MRKCGAWEVVIPKGARVPTTVERLVRTMVALDTFKGDRFPVRTLAEIKGDAGPLKLVVTVDE
jgi:hypothetical protein